MKQEDTRSGTIEKPTCRPREHLVAASKLYPSAWKLADEFRSARDGDVGNWPDWCFLPLAGWYAIVSSDAGVHRLGLDRVLDVGRLGAIGAWRVTQGIYRFDSALYDALIDTPMNGDIPCEVLYRLPEWCVYVETPGLTWDSSTLYGFWAHLEADANTGRAELRLLIDSDADLSPLILHFGAWSLSEAIARAQAEAHKQCVGTPFAGLGNLMAGANVNESIRSVIEPLLSLLLYLCSENAEIGDGSRKPAKPVPKRVKGGWRLFPPDRQTTWGIGVRLGSALRRTGQFQREHHGGTHTKPLPHIRRAHWHGFRSGPLKRADGAEIPTVERPFSLKWLPPIPVNVEDVDELQATIRPLMEK